MQSFPVPFQDSPSVFPDIWELRTKMARPKSSGSQKLFGGKVVGGANLTVAEMAAHSKLLSLLGRL